MAMVTFGSIGVVRAGADGFRIEVDDPCRAGLEGLDGFGWVQLLWWAHQADPSDGDGLVCAEPYRGGPERLGVFATRHPRRPNPIGLSVAQLTGVDVRRGILHLAWVDCLDGTPLLDLKPYHPSADRVEIPRIPAWCAHWPASVEASASFDWGRVFPA
jgi:tRNA-Thr(GGU) m(6)t(6)A37 methyltransferase TsaA